MTELSTGALLLIAAAMTVILVQHGWNGVKNKLSVVFLGKDPGLVR